MTKFRDSVIILVCLLTAANTGFSLKDDIDTVLRRGYLFRTMESSHPTVTPKTDMEAAPFTTAPPEVAPPEDHPPLFIVGGVYSYRIHYTTHEWLISNDCGGVTIHTIGGDKPELRGLNHTIWLYPGDENPRLTLMHELFHIAKRLGDEQNWDVRDDSHPNQNHDFINPAAPEMLVLMRRNPKLMRWLMERKPIMHE